MDFFKNLFGLPNHQPNSSERFFDFQEDNSKESNDERHFNVFTDPLEMHRYFEKQMDEVFRTFGFPNFGNIFHQTPAISGDLEDDLVEESQNLREKFLKNEFAKPHYEEFGEKADKDLDGKLNLGDLDSVFKGSSDKHSLDTFRKPMPLERRFFSQSVQVKTIKKPDGSIETHETVRDNQGNEETTITQTLGDKEYTIVKKLSKDGQEETQEIMKNMDENDKVVFQNRGQKEHNIGSSGVYFDSSLFNKFFK